MEDGAGSEDRLYSGPLSQAAKKILAVLRTNSLVQPKCKQPFTSQRSETKCSQSGSWALNCTSQEKEKDEFPYQPQVLCLSTPEMISQTSSSCQRPDSSLPSQTSPCLSICLGSSLQRQTPQTVTYYQLSQTFSIRNPSESSSYLSSRAPLFSQHRALESEASICGKESSPFSNQEGDGTSKPQTIPSRNPHRRTEPSFTFGKSSDEEIFSKMLSTTPKHLPICPEVFQESDKPSDEGNHSVKEMDISGASFSPGKWKQSNLVEETASGTEIHFQMSESKAFEPEHVLTFANVPEAEERNHTELEFGSLHVQLEDTGTCYPKRQTVGGESDHRAVEQTELRSKLMMERGQLQCSDIQLQKKECERNCEESHPTDAETGKTRQGRHVQLFCHDQRSPSAEVSDGEWCLVPTLSQVCGTQPSVFRAPCLLDNQQHGANEHKLASQVCGLLILMKSESCCSTPEDSLGLKDSLVYLTLKHIHVWVQDQRDHDEEQFTRDLLLQVISRSPLAVCYKAKDLLRTVLQFYKEDSWKQVSGCQIQDPQVSGWLLDPADQAACYQDLLYKHCKKARSTHSLGPKKVSQILSDLCWLHKLHMILCSKLQSRGLWKLYTDVELKMIPVLAAMESHCIYVDKETLKKMSDLLGTKLKQLEQEAHQAAGQRFLVTSSSQLRTVLFEKLRLHEYCENKKLPKTINKQQSTSEAALLQLQDLHPLPKIILEYRQVHKIKSTFIDGILTCMKSKNYISSTWCQTSAVTGRISAKHPNFQALPKQPLQITKKLFVHGGAEEVVTVHPRAMFVPHKGWTFLAADFCQVELRLLAHFSSDPDLLHLFTIPQADVFTMLAAQWKGLNMEDVSSEDREHAKRIIYSVIYGAGRERLSGILGVSAEQASQFQHRFLQTYRDVQTFIQKTIQQSHKQGYVLSIMGRRRNLPDINSPDWGVRMQSERQAVNFVVQGSAADLCKMAMIRIFNLVSTSSSLTARLVAQLHDELLYEVEDSQLEPFATLVKSTMESLQHIDHLGVHLKVPLKVAVSSGKTWGSMSEFNIPLMPPSS
ncbi:DNA polymerase nu isoform X9 [Oryzias latipes]